MKKVVCSLMLFFFSCESPFLQAKGRSSSQAVPIKDIQNITLESGETPKEPNPTSSTVPTQTSSCPKKTKKGECVELVFGSQPTLNREVSALLTFKVGQSFSESVKENHLKARMGMKSMGHVSELEIFEEKSGVFRLDGLFFTMPGKWEVKIDVVDESGKSSESWEWDVTL